MRRAVGWELGQNEHDTLADGKEIHAKGGEVAFGHAQRPEWPGARTRAEVR